MSHDYVSCPHLSLSTVSRSLSLHLFLLSLYFFSSPLHFQSLLLHLPVCRSCVSISLTGISMSSFVLFSMSLGRHHLLSTKSPHPHAYTSLLSLPQFNPELVLVSAGFDAARGDPLGGCQVSPEGYAHLTHLLMGLASGRIILILEVILSWSLFPQWEGSLEMLAPSLRTVS